MLTDVGCYHDTRKIIRLICEKSLNKKKTVTENGAGGEGGT